MDQKISDLFFGLNLNQKPRKITKESDFEFDFSIFNLPGMTNYSYSTKFVKHPTIRSNIKSGKFSIDYDSNNIKYGIFELVMVIHFENEYDQLDEYEKLKYEFEPYSSKTIIETSTNENHETLSQYVGYQKNKDVEIPKISFYFDQYDKTKFPLVIHFYNTWKEDHDK